MQEHLDILKKYWQYDSFRDLQGDIIDSIASGKDTLGLMPTGGGKSLTFQVPTMAMEGLCLVITPLIALMKDQVENLKKRGIRAAAISSDMSKREIFQTLENAVFDAYKFLYISPERLGTEVFVEKISQAKICMIAVDESHCISQWGYDFRPSYLRIAEIRKLMPDIPFLALTATATKEVVNDIQERLLFREKNVFRKSFHRSNLAYVVRASERKENDLLKILKKVSGSSVVYVRNRKRTKEIAEFLQKNEISAEYFHAGLQGATKDARQKRWKADETRVIVSTNAFGMGIDKPDVRTVIHMDLPDSLEAYFQEAGRAGRDGEKAFAVMLYNRSDETKLNKRIVDSFPKKEFIISMYESLGNYFKLAVGFGLESVFAFDIADFCSKYRLPILSSYNGLKILQQAGYLELSEEQDNSSQVMFLTKKDELYNIEQKNEDEAILALLLRSYTGLFSDTAYISEKLLAERLQCSQDDIYQRLTEMSKKGIIKYIPRKKTPFIFYTRERVETKRLLLNKESYEDRKERYESRINSVLGYAQETDCCRSRLLLRYFGEKESSACGICDICLKKREKELSENEFATIRNEIINCLRTKKKASSKELIEGTRRKELKVMQVLRFMLEQNELKKDKEQLLRLTETE